MVRFADWQMRLDCFLNNSAAKPFAYGETDCCLFVADAVFAMSGVDLAASFRGRYHSRKEALAVAKKRTGKASLRLLIETALADLPAVSVLSAQRGDILLVKRSRDVSLGILSLNGKEIVAAAAEGFLRLPLSLALRAWRV